MNSFSTKNYKDNLEHFCEPDKLSSLLLKCGNSGSAILPEGSSLVTVFPLININTSQFSNSCIKLNFTSNVIAINLVGSFIFQLFKLCDNQLQSTTVGPQWIFSRSAPDDTDISSFSFSVCDRDCNFCLSKECKYAVVMLPSDGNAGSVVVTNATLSAIALNNSSAKLMKESTVNNKNNPCIKPYLGLRPAILKCGASQLTLFRGESINAITTTSTVASVKANTSCLCNPCIRFEFASNIIVPTGTEIANITFQIFKNCTNQSQPIPVGPQWTFRTPVATSDTFSFFVCDCNTCSNECCTYTVQATARVLAIGDAGATTTVTIKNATLSVLAVDNSNENC